MEENSDLKKTLRRRIFGNLEALPPEEKSSQDLEIMDKIRLHPWFIQARGVLGFRSFESEPNLEGLWLKDSSRRWYFPRIEDNDGRMSFRKVSAQTQWETHSWGMVQPSAQEEIFDWKDWETSEVVILAPGLAFDMAGGRLGRGKGFFDRFLQNSPEKCRVLGIARQVQILEKIPMTDHDFPVGALVTEKISLIFS